MNETVIKQIPRKIGKKPVFLSLFGVSFAAFALGFDDCLFDIDTVDTCVLHAQSWIEPFQSVGDHLINWMIALTNAAFK